MKDMQDMKDWKIVKSWIMPYMRQTASFSTLARASRSMAACEGRNFSSTSFSSLERLQRNIKHTCRDLSLMAPRCVRQCHSHMCHGQKSLYWGWSSHLNRNPYNGYINPYYWIDDHPLLDGNNGSLDPGTYSNSETAEIDLQKCCGCCCWSWGRGCGGGGGGGGGGNALFSEVCTYHRWCNIYCRGKYLPKTSRGQRTHNMVKRWQRHKDSVKSGLKKKKQPK